MWFPFKKEAIYCVRRVMEHRNPYATLSDYQREGKQLDKYSSVTDQAFHYCKKRKRGNKKSCPFIPSSLPHSIINIFWNFSIWRSTQGTMQWKLLTGHTTPMETGPVLLQELDYCHNYNHFLPHPTPGYYTFQDSKLKIILFLSSEIHLSGCAN